VQIAVIFLYQCISGCVSCCSCDVFNFCTIN